MAYLEEVETHALDYVWWLLRICNALAWNGGVGIQNTYVSLTVLMASLTLLQLSASIAAMACVAYVFIDIVFGQFDYYIL